MLLSLQIEAFIQSKKGSFVFSFRLFGRANQLSDGNSNSEPNDHYLHRSYIYYQKNWIISISNLTKPDFQTRNLTVIYNPCYWSGTEQ